MLQVHQCSFSYGEKPILKGVDFRAYPEEVISVIGPNGSGKSTLLRCLCGLLKVPGDTIQINNKSLYSYKKKDLSKIIAFLPQSQDRMMGITVRDLVALGRTPYQRTGWYCSQQDKEMIQWAMEYMQITKIQHRMVDTLSGGERQRVWIAMVLAQDTTFILLDEPVTYMDLRHQWELLETIHQLKEEFGKTIISVFHDINHAMEVSDRVYIMHGGRVYQSGSVEEVITEKNLQEVYGLRTHICRVKDCCRSVIVPEGRSKNHRKRQQRRRGNCRDTAV